MSEDIETNSKLAEIEVFDPERNGIAFKVSGADKDKVAISDSNNLILTKGLDYEQKKLDIVLEVFDGKNTVLKPLVIKINNVNDLTALIDFDDKTIHEGQPLDSLIGNINVIGDNNLKYSLIGDNSGDFKISSDGKIKVNKTLDFSSKDSYQLTLKVEGQMIYHHSF